MIQEIVVASGKGGTGKTFISSNLSYFFFKNGFNILSIDADVEAPDLLLALGGVKEKVFHEDFYGSVVDIDYNKCIRCGLCADVCRFNAISIENGLPKIDYNSCEGFGTCMLVCPVKAIFSRRVKRGDIFIAISNEGIPIVTGDLDVGERNSGLLVYRLRDIARKYALERGLNIMVIDAAPGIGCPVISSIVGVKLLVIIIEPSPQSLKGAE
ncbi:MAG TPA: 4Fe-4S dicluster domain-containing protein, partial [Thermoprotei archaeon]|nr:4Fe-4S dicluster domain-containing protein [Thermoprotei archaeon]